MAGDAVVTAVITSFNRPASLRRAVESALRQTVPIEIIVVDDCSPYDVGALLAPYPAVRLIRETKNRGVSHSRNLGAAEAGGAFVAFLDDDDAWAPEKTEQQLATIGDSVINLCGFTTQPGRYTRVRRGAGVSPASLRMGNAICGASGFFVRRDLFAHVQFDAALRYGEDWDFLVQALRFGGISYCPEALFEYTMDTNATALSTQFKRLGWSEMGPMFAAGEKHRQFMGDHCYRRRIARMTLAHLPSRADRVDYIFYALRTAGPVATVLTLSEAAARRLAQAFGNA